VNCSPSPVTSRQGWNLRGVKWRDENGVQQLCGKFRDAYLPPALAEKAIKAGCCAPISDPRRKALHNSQGDHPRLDTAYDLDADPAHQPIEEPIEEISYFGSDLLPAILRMLLTTAFTLAAMSALST